MEAKTTTRYWSHQAVRGLTTMRLAREMGLFPKKEGWRNVQEHELVQAEVSDVLAVATGCPERVRKDLSTAGRVHDVGKRLQIGLIKQKGDAGQLEAFRIQSQRMSESGVSERAIALTESCGHTSLVRFLKDPSAKELELRDNLDKPTLIIHYADDITRNTDLVTVDQRMNALENRQPPYPEAILGGDIFGGRTYYQVQRIVGHLVENKLAEMIGIAPQQMQEFIKSQINERIRLHEENLEKKREIEQIVINSLQAVFTNHKQLGEKGKQVLRKNQFDQDTLEADWQAEEVIIQHLRTLKLPIRIISEEHGIVDIGEELGMESTYTAILDGLDGTKIYREGKGRYGTMLAIFQGINPKYKDYISCGILEYPTGRILSATSGQKTWLLEGDQKTRVTTSRSKTPDLATTKIEVDGGFDGNSKFAAAKLSGFEHVRIADLSSSIYYFDLATGSIDMIVVSTRKRNLEMAAAYGIVREAFGVMIDETGHDIGDKEYLKFGQGENDRFNVLSFASKTMGEKFIEGSRQ